MKHFLCLGLAAGLAFSAAGASISKSPYIGAIAVDASDGRVLFEDDADRAAYPASMLKLMDMFLVFDRLQDGRLRLADSIHVSKLAQDMGGSQVFLAQGEVFPLEEMLYALMIQSANDAAMAIAEHVAGSRDGFVALMNQKAKELGMATTWFQSPHGLPPDVKKGQRPDISTPRDFAKLCVALLKAHPGVLAYTSATERPFRPGVKGTIDMRSHNRLLFDFPGCDGLKTGYYKNAGYSIAATAQRDGARVIVVIMGSMDAKERDAKARELLNRYLPEARRIEQPASPPVIAPQKPVAVATAAEAADADETPDEEDAASAESVPRYGWLGTLGWMLAGAFLMAVFFLVLQRRRDMRR